MSNQAATPPDEPATSAAGPGPAADVVVIGASAGGVGTLAELVERLRPGLGAALLVVLHVPTTGTSVLADILQRRGTTPVVSAVDGRELRRGEIVVARPDRHLLVDGDRVVLAHSARVNGHRPAIDPLFESASRSYGPKTLGILLSGMLDDGVVGLGDIRAAGGVTAVQDPAEAPYPGMPVAAIEAGVVDHSLPLVDLVELIASLTTGASGPLVPQPPGDGPGPGEPELTLAALSCPNCGGSLWHSDRPGGEQYECRVGHRYSPTSLFQIQGDALDDALWTAHRALLERADLARRMARRMRRSNLSQSAARYDRTVHESEESAAALLQALTAKAEHEPHEDAPGTHHVGRN